jgi:hypothetical protein
MHMLPLIMVLTEIVVGYGGQRSQLFKGTALRRPLGADLQDVQIVAQKKM